MKDINTIERFYCPTNHIEWKLLSLARILRNLPLILLILFCFWRGFVVSSALSPNLIPLIRSSDEIDGSIPITLRPVLLDSFPITLRPVSVSYIFVYLLDIGSSRAESVPITMCPVSVISNSLLQQALLWDRFVLYVFFCLFIYLVRKLFFRNAARPTFMIRFFWYYTDIIPRELHIRFLAQLTMSARAFPITMCPSSVRLSVCPSVCPSVKLFFKTYLLLQFWMDCFQILHRCYPQGWLPGLCFFWRSDHFWNFGEFLKFWNIGITYSNCKVYLLLQFSFNRFEIMQGSSIGYRHYGLCFFWRSN